MAMTECADCGHREQSRSTFACLECGVPLCSECARENEGYCAQCREGRES